MNRPFYSLLAVAGAALLTAFAAVQQAQTPPAKDQPVRPAVATEQLSLSFAAAAKAVEPAVVSIDSKGRMPAATGSIPPGVPKDMLEMLEREMARRPSYSVGSGFIIDKRGYILTNRHVVENAARITVQLFAGDTFVADVIGSDEETDLAVLKINAGRDLPVAELGDSSTARVGDWVLAIGSPFGLNRSVTAGIISQTQRATPGATTFQRFIQTDAAINRGNSGGPLVDMQGKVIGVNSQIATSSGDFNGVGFALPATDAANVADQIIKTGKVRRGYLGITLESVKPEFAKVYGMSDAKGAIVMDVRSTTAPAAAAGIKAEDVIVEFNGKTVESAQDLIGKVAAISPDESVTLKYLRPTDNGMESRTASMKLGERPSDPRSGDREGTGGRRTEKDLNAFGLTVADLTADIVAEHDLQESRGVLVKSIDPESYIADVKVSTGFDGLVEGDVIVRINRKPATDVKTFTAIANSLKKGDPVVLHVLALDPRRRRGDMKIVQFTVQ